MLFLEGESMTDHDFEKINVLLHGARWQTVSDWP